MPEFNDETFKSTLIYRFKETALKAFLCRAARAYEAFSIQVLCENFEISRAQVMSILNKMILRNKIHAHLDSTSDSVVMDEERKLSNEAKELQQLSV